MKKTAKSAKTTKKGVKQPKTVESVNIAKKTVRLFTRLNKLWAPPTKKSVSEWADENRILQSETAAEPGPWRTSRTPYLREIMDNLSASSPVKETVLMKAAQLGGSESGNNWIGYVMSEEPGPMMMVQPAITLAKQYSQRNIAPMIRACPVLQEVVKDVRVRDSGNTTLRKEFPGGLLVIVGAESAAGLRSMPVKNLFMDEVDAYPADVEGEGDPVDLAMARTRTFARKKILEVSTPTVAGESRIEKAYLETDQRRYFVPCPHCGHMHTLIWEHFIIPSDDDGNKLPDKAHMVCPECGAIIEEWQKTQMLENGEWRMTNPQRASKTRRGYHINSLYSPVGLFSWAEIAQKWLEIKKDQSRLKTFINTVLGETWSEDTEIIDYEQLYNSRRYVYPAPLPDDVLVLTAAVDTQDNRLEYELKGWGVDHRSWGIEYGVILGDPQQPEVWKHLDEWLMRQWRYADGIPLSISCTCIDSGGHATDNVYDFCKNREYRRVYAIKGRGGSGVPLISRPSTANRKGVNLFTLGVDGGKETVMARLKVTDESMPGYCYYPMGEDEQPVNGYDMKYFKGLTVERRRPKYVRGRLKYEWYKPSGARNEPLDLAVYNTAALEILNPPMEQLAAASRKEIAAVQNNVQRPQAAARRRRVLSSGIGGV